MASDGERRATTAEHEEAGARLGTALALLLVALLLVPSANVAVFSGLPLSSPVELAGLLLVAPLLFSPTLRHGAARRLRSWGRAAVAVVLVAGVAALGVKVALFASGTREGFLACYQAVEPLALPQAPTPEGCERSYENPGFRFRATRLDRTIDFGRVARDRDFPSMGLVLPAAISRTDWDLSFMNSRRFNYAEHDQPDLVHRVWLQFRATWRGAVDGDGPRRLAISYVGEGRVRVGDRSVRLPPAYRTAATAHLTVPAGRHDVAVSYRFARPFTGEDVGRAAYATLRLGDGQGHAVRAVAAPGGWRVAGWLGDGFVALLLLALLAHLATVLVSSRWVLLGVAAGTGGAALAGGAHGGQAAFAVVVCGLFLALALRHADRPLVVFGLTAYAALVAVELVRAVTSYGGLGPVLYRGGAEDFLTYEHQARRILETGSLQAGEDVFSYSSGFRYLVFLAHLVFGDRDVMIGVAGLVALGFSVFLLAHRLLARSEAHRAEQRRESRQQRRQRQRSRKDRSVLAEWLEAFGVRRALVVVALLAVVLVVEAAGVQMVQVLMSEYPTWVFLLVAAWCFLGPWSRRRALLGTVLVGLALFVRADQAPGLLLLLAAALVACLRRREAGGRRWLAAGALVGVLGVIAMVPAAHNLHYGHRLAVVAKTPNLPVNFPLPPSKALRVLSDAEARSVLGDQLAGVLVTTRLTPVDVVGLTAPFLLGVRLLQVLWLACLVWTIARWRRVSVAGRVLVLLPLAYLVPHVFIQVYVYYPRHVIAGYLAMGIAAAVVLSDAAQLPATAAPGSRRRRAGHRRTGGRGRVPRP